MDRRDAHEELRHELKAAWHRFLDLVQSERPALHSWFRERTGSVWDAEDLVQDTLLRAFGTFGKLDYPLSSATAFLRRLAVDARTVTAPERAVPSEELVDHFVAAYNAGDPEALAAFLRADGTVEMLGCVFQTGPEAAKGDRSWFRGALGGHPEWPASLRFDSQRAERARFDGEPIVLVFRTRQGEEALESIVRLLERDGRISLLRVYTFCPDTVRAVGSELGLLVRTGPYRYPTPVPGESYRDAKAGGQVPASA